MKTRKRMLAAVLAAVMALTVCPSSVFAGYDTAESHVNSVPAPVFTYEGEYAEYGQIACGDPFDMTLGWTSYSGEPMPVGEITEITLVMAGDASKFYVLYKDGVAYYGAEASIDG
ncbi:MAG: hypothetical protein K6C36_00590, partial [Clostridia bacterium]|nr:hypothetical protein [Clostridia bacterium]